MPQCKLPAPTRRTAYTEAVRRIADTLTLAGGAMAARPLRSSLGALAVAVAVATMVLVTTALDGLAEYARHAGHLDIVVELSADLRPQ